MEAFVRKGYVVFDGIKRYEEGDKIPSSILNSIINNQSWKVEVKNGKQKRQESTEEQEERAEAASSDGKKEEIEEITSNKMFKPKDMKRR